MGFDHVTKMTKKKLICALCVCRKRFSPPARGRTPKYCCRAHRQRAYELRRAQESIPMLLLGRDIDEYRTRAGIERAVVDTLRRFGFLPPAPKGAPPIRLVRDGTSPDAEPPF
jgi:hypothetical protein